jgi:hypothetical protein
MLTKKLKQIPTHHASVSLLSIISLLVVGLGVASLGVHELLPSHAATLGFTLNGSQIVDPDGKVFIPVGANASGPHFPFGGPLIGNSAIAQNDWKWNTLRVNTCAPGGCENGGGYDNSDDNDLTGIINEYTAKHIVIMIDWQQPNPGTDMGTQSDKLAAAISFWKTTAAQYKDNPYVWFNLNNEPSGSISNWVSGEGQIAAAVRAIAPNNIIVIDGSGDGQDAQSWDCNAVNPANSAIISGGQQLESQYTNVVFSLHVYGWWGGNGDGNCTPAQLDARMGGFIDQVHQKNLPLVIGEVGAEETVGEEQSFELGTTDAAHSAYREAPTKGVGLLWWHSAKWGNNYPLIQDKTDWTNINNPTNPTNLSWGGQMVWNYGQTMAKTAAQLPAPPPTPPAPTPVGSYNDTVLTYNGGWQTSTGAGKYNSDDHYSSNANDTSTLDFTGAQQIKIYGAKGPTYGKATFSIDGGAATTVDLYAATRTDDVVIYTNPTALTTGKHTITITVTGTKNAASTDAVVSLDQVDVLATFSGGTTTTPPPVTTPTGTIYSAGIQDDSVFTYSTNWQASTGTGKYNNTDHYASAAGETATLSFTGTQLKIYGAKFSYYGTATVSIDGSAPTTIDAYNATRIDDTVIYTSPTLTDTTHTVTLTLTGNKNASSTGTTISIDQVDVIETALAPVPGDTNNDRVVDSKDIATIVKYWGQHVTAGTNGDLNGNGVVDTADIPILIHYWPKS